MVLANYISGLNEDEFVDENVSNISTYEVTKTICSVFKNQIENKKAYQLLYTDDGKPRK
ncbi:hypothetical protein ACQQ2T_04920 [Paraclostridium tenue]